MASKEIIEKLTEEQEAQLDVYAERWIEIGLDTKAAERQRAENEVRKLYVQEGLKAPGFEWFDSPIAAVKHLRKEGVDNPLRAAVYGQHTAGWCGYLSYLREVLDFTEETKDALPHIELAKCCGWWFAFEHIAVMTDKPCLLNLDEQGELHNEDGPALQYPDQEALYAVHGVVVPADVILKKDDITIDQVINEPNAEIRRVMTEVAPWEKLVAQADVLDTDKDAQKMPRRLLRLEFPNDEAVVLVEVLDSTEGPGGRRKTYYLRVPPNIETCKEAVAWTFDMEPNEYRPTIET
jgi:hypothetical protein